MKHPEEEDGQQSVAHRWLASDTPIEQVPVASLQRGDSPRLKGDSKLDAAWLRVAANTPPIIVHRATMGIIDGARRVAAARQRDQNTIAVQFFDGTTAAAFVLAVVANLTTHGQPLTPKDRKAAAARILGMYPDWSDRLIAFTAGLSHHTVSVIRRNLSTGQIAQFKCRLGKDGKTRTAGFTKSRGTAAAASIHADQSASPHGVDGQVDGPGGTVHDVRARRERGGDPSVLETRGAGLGFSIARGQTVVQKLRNNPSVWMTDNGKALVRMLLHSVQLVGMVQAASRATPEHCRGVIAEAASALSDAWNRVAQELRTLNRIV